MPERKKLELELSKKQTLELLFDEPITGQSKYGPYWMYTLKDASGEEFLYFAPEEVNEKLKSLQRGDRFEITKLAEQKGTKIVTKYDIRILTIKETQSEPNTDKNVVTDNYFDVMLASYQDALKIQEKLGTMIDTTKISICLFIARTKINGSNIS